MSSLILPRRFYSQPQGACRINPGFDRPGNTVLWLPTARKLDVARGREGTVNLEATYGVTFGADQDSIVMLPDVAHSRCIHWPVTDSAPKWTLLLRFRFVSNTAPYSGLAEYSNAVNSGTPRFLVQSRSDGNIYCHDGGGYRITDTGGAAKFAGKPETLIARWDGATLHYYRPGAHLTYTGTPSNAASNIRFGSGYPSCSDINMSLGYWAEDDLGEAACQDLLSNPWQLFRAQKRVLYFTTAAGTSVVSQTLSDSALIVGVVSQTLADSAVVRASATQSMSDSYSVATSASNALSDSALIRTSTTQNLLDSYNVLGSATQQLADSSLIRTSVSPALADSYAIRTSIAQAISDSYAIENAGVVSNTLSDSSLIRSAVSAGLSDSAEIRTSISITLNDGYIVRGAAAQPLADSYDIAAAGLSVTSTITDSYAIVSTVSATLADSYAVQGAGITLSPEDIAAIAEAVWQHATGASVAVRLAEAWGRLGLDPSAPLVTGTTSITFGEIAMALTESGGAVTVARQ